MKKSPSRKKTSARSLPVADLPYLPTPNQQLQTTSDSGSGSGLGSLTRFSELEKDTAAKLDAQSGKFYTLVCELADKTEVHPMVALHAMELFIQSLKRAERARLGVSNPEKE